MAGKGGGKNRKSPKKHQLDIERFAYDVLSFILPLGGFPVEKIKQKDSKPNVYKDSIYVFTVGAVVMCVSLNHRDQWKTMFESRFKSSGLDTNEKVEKYLSTILAIKRDFQEAIMPVKVHVSLAAYFEMMLFLTYKNVEFDFDQMITSWSRCFKQYTAQYRNTDEILNNLFLLASDPFKYIEFITSFMQNVASPYGSRDCISALFNCVSDNAYKKEDKKDKELVKVVKVLAKKAQTSEEPVLPADFESSVVLPGDRESPEPPLSPGRGAVGGRKKHSRIQTRSTNIGQSRTEERRRGKAVSELKIMDKFGHLILNSKTIFQKIRDENPERRNPKKIDLVEPVSLPGFESSAVLPGDRQSSELLASPERAAVEGRKEYRKEQTSSTNVGQSRTEERQKGKTLSKLEIMDRRQKLSLIKEAISQKIRDENPERKPPKKADLVEPVSLPGFESLAVLPGDRESSEPLSSPERDAVGGRKEYRKEQISSTNIGQSRTEERQKSRALLKLEIIEKLRKLSLINEAISQKIQEENTERKPPKKSDLVEPVSPTGFESPAVVPGDRESPEPPLSPERGAVGGRKN